MARPLKEGLDYYPRQVGIYKDPKVIKLILACGWLGVVIWDYLLDQIYENGYFYPWDDESPKSIAFSMSGHITDGQVREVVEACCKCGLFDKTVLTACGILTSRGIQRRYCTAAAERRHKKVISEYWLLEDSESAGFEKCPLKEVSPPNNPSKSPNNPSKSTRKSLKDSKAKDSKGEDTPPTPPRGKPPKEKADATLREVWDKYTLPPLTTKALAHWLRYKTEKRDGYKPSGLNSLLSQAEKHTKTYGDAAVAEIIESSMASNYKGITWDRLRKEGANATDFGNLEQPESRLPGVNYV